MEEFLVYSLESAICLAILLLPYLLLFRKTTFHQWNRFYLLGAIIFSLFVPLVDIVIEVQPASQLTQFSNELNFDEDLFPKAASIPNEAPTLEEPITTYSSIEIKDIPINKDKVDWDIFEVLSVVYFVGVALFLSLFLFRLTKLYLLIKGKPRVKLQYASVVQLSSKQVFSFFNFIFLNPSLYNQVELDALLKHEQEHIRQWHSLDLLFLEVAQVIFWFNPLFYFYKKQLQQEQEYFVDAAISISNGKPQYAQLLLSLATSKPPLVGHAFAYIPVKHRIFKLFQKPSVTMEKSRFLVAIPIAISLFFAFSCSFERLNGLSANAVSKGKKVKNVYAYYQDERAELNQELNVGAINFKRDGGIINLDIKEHPLFGHDLPKNPTTGYLWQLDTEFFEHFSNKSDLPSDFYSKRVQWLLAGDGQINTYPLAAILYHNVGMNWLNIGKEILGKSTKGYRLDEINENGEMTYSFSGEEKRPNKHVWAKRESTLNANGQITSFTHYDRVLHNLKRHNSGDALLDSILNNIVRLVSRETNDKIVLKYTANGLLESLESKSYAQSEFKDGVKRGSTDFKSNGSFQFFYNEQSNLAELHFINNNGLFLRKYRYYYNESGYCTKKECINREGGVEFSVRFEYDYF